VSSVASAGPKGTVPREDADKYQAHEERDGLKIAAEILTPDKARKAFSSNVNRCCIVVEVAFYPQKDKPVSVLLDDFSIQPPDTDYSVRPISPQVVAARLVKKSESTRHVETVETVGVGYESGTYIDPVTGRPVRYHGVTTEAGVGVGVGPSGYPGQTQHDRDNLEGELSEKAVPEGVAAKAVAGYLYFPSSVREKKKTPLRLKYKLGDQTITFDLQ
jgi:hypothetical protein